MELDDLRRLADAFEASDWDEVHLVLDGVEIHLSATGGPLPKAPAAAPAPAAASVAAVAAPLDDLPLVADPLASAAAEPGPDPGTGEPVAAPSPGIYWRAPAPGQPPFVEIGDEVGPESVIGIVELMKLMNRITAGVAGVVTAICVANGQSVEKGAVLVRIEPK